MAGLRTDTITAGTEKHYVSNGLRLAAGVAGAAVLILLAPTIQTVSHALLYAATWITFLHIALGVDAMVRCLHAYAKVQQALDVVAGALLGGFLVSFTTPALWCGFLAGVIGVAVLKYGLLYRSLHDRVLRRYTREKMLLEGPGVPLLALVAAILAPGELPAVVTLGIAVFLLAGTTAFAVWMIGIKKRYRQLRAYVKEPDASHPRSLDR